MAKQQLNVELRAWARIGAEQRLVELAEEAAAIHRTFPELRDRYEVLSAGGSKPTEITAGIAEGCPPPVGRSSGRPSRKGGQPRRTRERRGSVNESERERWIADLESEMSVRPFLTWSPTCNK